jgi:hypothetical protein
MVLLWLLNTSLKMGSPKLLKSGALSEKSIHKTVMARIRADSYLKRFVLHFPNEGKRDPNYGRLLQSYGMRKGVYDLFITIPMRGFGGAWIELKTVEGKLSKEQIEFGKDMEIQNYFTKVTYGLDEALEIIDWYVFKKELNHHPAHSLE